MTDYIQLPRILYWTAADRVKPTLIISDNEENPRNLRWAWEHSPKGVFGIEFGLELRAIAHFGDKNVTLKSELLNRSPRYLVNGKLWHIGDSFQMGEHHLFNKACNSPSGTVYQLKKYPFCVIMVRPQPEDEVVPASTWEEWELAKKEEDA